MSGEAYSAEVRRLFREAPGAGRAAGAGWVTGEASEPLSATRVRWHVRAEGGRIADVRYQVRGCPHTVAGVALAAAGLMGLPLAGPAPDFGAIAERLEAPPSKRGRFFVIEDALRAAWLQLQAAGA